METESPWASTPAEPPPRDTRDPGLIPPPGPNVVRRAIVSALGPVAVWVAGQVPLIPHTDYDTFPVSTLGVTPILTAFILVELAALIVPPWRPLRTSGRAGRARLGVAVVVLAVVITVGHAWIVANQATSIVNDVVEVASGSGIMVALVGTTGLFSLVAVMIDRHGLGSGFANLIVSGLLLDVLDQWRLVYQAGLVPDLVLPILAPIGVAAIGVAFAAGRAGPAQRGTHPGVSVPFLASGTAALGLFSLYMTLSYTLETFEVPLPRPDYEDDALLAMRVGFVLVGVFLGTLIFSGPRRVTGIVERGLGVATEEASTRARTAIGDAIRLAVLFGGGVLLIDFFALPSQDEAPLLPTAVTLLAIGTFARDLWLEWRARSEHPDLVEIWPSHRPYAVATVVHALRAEGIDAFVFGVGYRTLGQVFAPYVPMPIVVPEADGPRAQAIAAKILL